MHSLLNPNRPPVFCPGCAHDRVVHALDGAFQSMNLDGSDIAVVSDIGCSGLFDTFFDTHAFHGLHGRALTYAAGIKMAHPHLHVVVTMGDGGLGIGGAHLLSACRRNLDMTLLILNNFNYGMTGGQCSATTPADARVGSGFLNRLEMPLDVCRVAGAAGAPWTSRISTYDARLMEKMVEAIHFGGFSILDIWGICPGRYTRRNKITPKTIDTQLQDMPPADGLIPENQRMEYGDHYRQEAARLDPAPARLRIAAAHKPLEIGRREIMLLGSAGQRIITAGEILCLAGATAGLHATQKNDYPITVMRGHSVSELILSDTEIDYTGIEDPAVVIALAQEGVERRRGQLQRLTRRTLILKAAGVTLPDTAATVREIDLGALRIKSSDWALAALAVLARENRLISRAMLQSALQHRFHGAVREKAQMTLETIYHEKGE